MNKALKGDDYAQQVAEKTAKSILVLSKPSNHSKEEVDEAKSFMAFQLSQEKAMAAARRGPKEPADNDVHVGNVVGIGVKDVVGAITFKAPSGTEMVMNPVLGKKAVKADSPEGIAIRQDAIDTRAKAILLAGGSLNPDGSVKTSKAAQAITAYGVSTYTDNGKLFIGSKPAPVDVNAGKTPDKPLPIPTSAQDLKAGAYYSTQKGTALWTGEMFDDKITAAPVAGAPAAVAAPTAAPSGFATKPSYVPPPESPAGKAQAMRTKLEEEKVKSSQLKEQAKKQAGEKLSLDFSRDAATLSPIELSRKYDPIRSQLSTADKVKLQSEERKI